MSVLLKGCPRCGGDVVRRAIDAETLSLTCLQCGRDREVSLQPPAYRSVLAKHEAAIPRVA